MGQTFKKITITGALLITGGTVVPIVPSEMELQYSFSTEHPEVFTIFDPIASTTQPLNLSYIDADNDGIVYFSVFTDTVGNEVYTEISATKYTEMGGLDGYSKNPTKEEYLTLFESLVQPVEAAVTFDAATSPASGNTDGSYTSVVFSHTTGSASQRVILVGIADFGSSDIAASSSITYNGTSLTHYISKVQGDYDRAFIYYLADPSTGANNVSVTFNTTLAQYSLGAMTVYNAQVPLTGAQSAGGVGPTEPSITVTSATGDLVFDVAGQQQKTATLSVGASQTQRWLGTGSSRRDGGASTEPGGASITMSWTDDAAVAENWVQVGANIKAYATPTPPVSGSIDITLFD